jgi:long-chain fatty acid transport protein
VAAAPDGKAEFCADGEGFGVNAGILWEMCERHSLAFTYRSAVSVEMEGDFKLGGIPPGFPAAPRSDFETEIDFPAVLGLGYGFEASEKLRLGADVEWIGFSDYDVLPLDAGANTPLLPAPAIPQDWEDSWTFGFGGDYRLSDELVLRAGYIFIESPIPDETFSPTLPDADRHVLSVGLGYEQGANRLDAAYALSLFEDRDIRGNVNPAYDGEYGIESHLMSISYAYTF